MGFADAYLLRAGLREKLIENNPPPGLEMIVTIPVYHESGLERCLDSLFQCDTSGIRAEVIVLVNAPAASPSGILEQNRQTCASALLWIRDHPHPGLDCHLLLDHTFSDREAGVGMARKILMDEAVRRFNSLDMPEGIIASMDADAVVEKNYLQALTGLFRRKHPDGCSVYFEHPLSGPDFPDDIYRAAMQYELHQRYYLRSVRSTGYPHAFHTVGSCFAVRADVYCKEGGMNRRQGGEDFYFIQKVARRGNFKECNDTRVIPSPRPSDRVPFGTGPAVKRLLEDPGSPLLTCDPRPFTMLGKLFGGLDIIYSEAAMDHFMKSQPSVLLDFLSGQRFGEALVEMRRNSGSCPAFRKRFWRWFNMFRILKFIHHARDRGYPDIPVQEASRTLLKQYAAIAGSSPSDQPADREDPGNRESPDTAPAKERLKAKIGAITGTDSGPPSLKSLLEIYRQLDRTSWTHYS